MDIKKTLFWGIIFGIIIAMLTFDVNVFDPNHPDYLGVSDGYASMGVHFAVIVPMCVGAAFFMKYMDLKSVGGRENWDRRRKTGRVTSVLTEAAATALVLLIVSVLVTAIAAGLEIIPKELMWKYVWILFAVYGAASVLQLLIIKKRNARRFRKTS